MMPPAPFIYARSESRFKHISLILSLSKDEPLDKAGWVVRQAHHEQVLLYIPAHPELVEG